MPLPIDHLSLEFGPGSILALNLALALVMFGIAIDLSTEDFAAVVRSPKGPAIGLLCQFVLLPALTFALVSIIDPAPSIALGMMLVAACPGGNISNFFTDLAGGTTALSIGMTAISTTAAVIATPLNVAFWGSLHPSTAAILTQVRLDPVDLLSTMLVILAIPLVLGMTLRARRPEVSARLRRPMRVFSILFFLGFVVLALHRNFGSFVDHVGAVTGVVALQNAAAFGLGYGVAKLTGLSSADARAVSIEVGIQNSGLGLTLVFTFFSGLGGMALVTAWWGIWHIIAGMAVALSWCWFDRHRAAAGVVA